MGCNVFCVYDGPSLLQSEIQTKVTATLPGWQSVNTSYENDSISIFIDIGSDRDLGCATRHCKALSSVCGFGN